MPNRGPPPPPPTASAPPLRWYDSAFPLPFYCLSLTFSLHFLGHFTAFPWPFHCLSLTFCCLSTAFQQVAAESAARRSAAELQQARAAEGRVRGGPRQFKFELQRVRPCLQCTWPYHQVRDLERRLGAADASVEDSSR